MNTRTCHLCALAVALLVLSHQAGAAYPERPLRWIIPAAAGGGADSSARIIAGELTRVLGQQVVVDNRPGASGIIGVDAVAKATPDGYTLGAGNVTNIAMNRAVLPKLPYDPDKDLRAVVQTHFQPNVLVTTLSLPAKSVRELVDYAKKNPGKLLFASSGNGSSLHFAGELFKLLSDTDIGHVPYKSVPVALTDVMAGNVQLIFDNMSSAAPHVRGGRLRALGVTAAQRSAVLPDVPTIAEAGVSGYELVVWSGIIVPAGTPPALVERLNAAVNQVLQPGPVRDRLTSMGLSIVGGSADRFARLISSEAAKWADVAKRARIKAE